VKTSLNDKQIAELSSKLTESVRELLVTQFVWPMAGDQALTYDLDRQINRVISKYIDS